MYKIKLDDNSFIIADSEYPITVFWLGKKKTVSLIEYLTQKKYNKYYLLDMIDGKKIKRRFSVEAIASSPFPIGSRIKLAKDIEVNDLIMGKDGSPRKVKELHTGTEDMFEINVNGTTYTVNGGHILALVDKDTGDRLEVPVNVFMHMNDEFRSHYVMEKVIE